jgi:very-short-patch-repair endonuclease
VTSLSARGRIPFDPGFFDLLIIDEASQCDIASALPLLYRAKRAVIIGDPKQLRHVTPLSKNLDEQLLSKHDLSGDGAGWAYSVNSLFDLSSGLCRSEDIVDLRDHHRSHADIIDFSNKYFYEGRLRVATRYENLRPLHKDGPAVRWINVRGRVVRPSNGGAVNELEAKAVCQEIERIVLQQNYQGTIGVVSPFRAQFIRINDLVSQNTRLIEKAQILDFHANTAHGFQGDERDVIIFSPVVSEGMPDGGMNFLRHNPNLFNVAITRARAALVVVGDRAAILNCGINYLAKFAEYTHEITARKVVDLPTRETFGPEYPVVAKPELVSDWEKVLYKALYQAGLRPVPQYPVDKYILDFALMGEDRELCIEVDGERYHRNWDGELCRRDQIRNQRLIELGWDVMRFWVYQIRDDLDACVERIRAWWDAGERPKESKVTVLSTSAPKPTALEQSNAPSLTPGARTEPLHSNPLHQGRPSERLRRCMFCGSVAIPGPNVCYDCQSD